MDFHRPENGRVTEATRHSEQAMPDHHHAVLIHTDSKLYWRVHAIYTIHIFQHVDSDLLEVIVYNTQTDAPAVSLYVSMTGILPAVHEDIKLKYHARLHEARALRDRSSLASVHFKASDALMKHEITDECVSQYIVNHINVVRKKDSDEHLVLLLRKGTEGEVDMRALDVLPGIGFTPAIKSDATYVRRHNNASVALAFEALLSKAAKVTNAVDFCGSEDVFLEHQAAAIDTPRAKWQRAIKRVMQRLAIEKNTRMIKEYEALLLARKAMQDISIQPHRRHSRDAGTPSVYPGVSGLSHEGIAPLIPVLEPKDGWPTDKNAFLYHEHRPAGEDHLTDTELRRGYLHTLHAHWKKIREANGEGEDIHKPATPSRSKKDQRPHHLPPLRG